MESQNGALNKECEELVDILFEKMTRDEIRRLKNILNSSMDSYLSNCIYTKLKK